MTKKKLCLAICSLFALSVFSQFAPQVGIAGSAAIKYDSSVFKSWATGCSVIRGFQNIASPTTKASFGLPSEAIGKAGVDNFKIVSLGDKGIATLTFDRPIVNGAGADFAVFENTNIFSGENAFLELAFVEVSSDGKHFVRFPAISNIPTQTQVGGFASVKASLINNLAGKYILGYGTPFDLEDIKDSTGIDLTNVKYVRIIDVCGSINPLYASYDSKGNIINEPYATPFASGGFDLDGVGLINVGKPYNVSTFRNLGINNQNTYWDGSDGAKTFTSGLVKFGNNYNATYQSWDGFAYSSKIEIGTEAGISNQYNVYNTVEAKPIGMGDSTFVVCYQPLDMSTFTYKPAEITFTDNKNHELVGLYVANNRYTALSMLNGDSYAKKFGGTSGNDKDSLVLTIRGLDELGNVKGIIKHSLADFRNDDNTKDFIQNDWQWVDLSSFGKVSKVDFFLNTSDNGTYGPNTPLYFCLDNITVIDDATTTTIPVEFRNNLSVKLYPNPCVDYINVECLSKSTISVYSISGQLILSQFVNEGVSKIEAKDWNSGCYIVVIRNGVESKAFKIIKR